MNNPYLQSKQLWNDLYGSVEDKLKNAYRLMLLLAIVLIISLIGLISLIGHARVQPYVAVLHGNELLTLNRLEQTHLGALKPKLAALLSREFLVNWRNVSLDQRNNQRHFIAALAMTTGPVTAMIKAAPPQYKKQQLREIQLTSLIVEARQVIHLRWQETLRDGKNGELLARNHYSAELSFQFAKVANNRLIAEHNPLGFYIRSLAWNQDHTTTG